MASQGKSTPPRVLRRSHGAMRIRKVYDAGFEYDKVKEAYMTYFSTYFHPGYEDNETKVCTKKTMQKIVSLLKEARAGVKMSGKYATIIVSSYDLMNDVLILNRPEKPTRIVLGYEDAFDIICAAHRSTGHDRKRNMAKHIIKRKYVVPDECIMKFPEFCNICNDSKTPKKLPLSFCNDPCLDIMKMAQSDDEYKYVLVYYDTKTKFILLRPLISNDCHTEMSVELLKIFADFGTPDAIRVASVSMTQFLDVILINLKEVWPLAKQIKILNGKLHHEKRLRILFSFAEWMKTTGSKNWAIACHMIQWSMNYSTPYNKVFGFHPNKVEPYAEFPKPEPQIAKLNKRKAKLHHNIVPAQESIAQSSKSLDDPAGDDDVVTCDAIIENITKDKAIGPDQVVSVATNNDCHVCQEQYLGPNNCTKCKRPVHVKCSEMVAMESTSSMAVDVILCRTCILSRKQPP